ncbi:hypothetical protein G9A89_021045 [Geosiphon pyriformis]|nr:hypothetical protein G9A89_021045 [Geosiphon pyriformis]
MSNSWERVDIYYNKQHNKNNFKVTTTLDATTLEYYQSIYTHCKQRFNIPNGIETFKKTLYQYIENYINNYLFGDYNISELSTSLLSKHSGFNSQTLETYFKELNFNIIQYCEENYPVEQKFSLGFESETEEKKEKRKQKFRTTPNTLKTTAKYLQTLEQGTSFKLPLSITPFPTLLAQPQTPSLPLIQFSRIEDFHKETKSEQETENSENEEEMASTYIAKIPEFTRKDSETSPQEWFDKVLKAEDANGWNAARMLKAIPYFLQKMADKLIKKVCSHASEDLATAIQQTKNYEMTIEKANCTKLINLAIGKTSSAAEEKIDQLTKKVENYFTNQQQQQSQRYQPP